MKKVVIGFIGTNKYASFFDNFYRTVKRYFLPDCERTILFFTDTHPVNLPTDVVVVPIEHKPWPFVTLERFNYIMKSEATIRQHDWFVYLDADMAVNTEILSTEFFNSEKEWFGVQHPGFINGGGTFEYRKKSRASVNIGTDNLSTYWQGCLWGGKTSAVLELCKELAMNTTLDLNEGTIAVWHDESHLNKFFTHHKKDVHTLDAGYAYPEMWTLPFAKKIVHIDKGSPSPEEFLRNP
jgi:hypothetical protein